LIRSREGLSLHSDGAALRAYCREMFTKRRFERIAARVLGILTMITVSRVWAKEVAMAKIIEFYIPKNFRKSLKWVPELQRGKILEFCPETKKSA
jgi:hypothetical protein